MPLCTASYDFVWERARCESWALTFKTKNFEYFFFVSKKYLENIQFCIFSRKKTTKEISKMYKYIFLQVFFLFTVIYLKTWKFHENLDVAAISVLQSNCYSDFFIFLKHLLPKTKLKENTKKRLNIFFSILYSHQIEEIKFSWKLSIFLLDECLQHFAEKDHRKFVVSKNRAPEHSYFEYHVRMHQ